MKLLFYINSIHHGGAQRVMLNLANQFASHGYEVILVTSFVDHEWEYRVPDGVKRVTLFEHEISNNLVRNAKLTLKLRKLIKSENVDVTIAFMAEPNFRAIVASIGLGNKVIISVRNDPKREYPVGLNRFLAKTLFRLADGVVFQTEDAQKWFSKTIQRKSKVIFNQVDEVFYQTHYDGERHDIVTTGRLVEQKNHKMLIRAFAMIADKVPDNLIIYGDGELRSELEDLIAKLHMQNRVFLPGSTKNVAETIKSAKLFVLSSDYEGMPNSLMEAMALGLPCISTDCPCGGPRMLIDDGVNGVLIETGSVSRMYKALIEIDDNEILRNKLAKNAKESASCFAPDVVLGQWIEYIKCVVYENS